MTGLPAPRWRAMADEAEARRLSSKQRYSPTDHHPNGIQLCLKPMTVSTNYFLAWRPRFLSFFGENLPRPSTYCSS
jgi:hypothetical protein